MLIELIGEEKIISITGMAKNSGKTVTLNRLLEEAFDSGKKIGLTSIGRDGESVDLVTETEKPKIFLESGSVFASSEGFLSMSDASIEILKNTEFRTPMGNVIIAKVREAGYVQIAGPQLLSEQRLLSEDMLKMGVDLVVIDGAIDRVSQAAPTISEGTILATGACLSRDIKKVVERTGQTVEALSLKSAKAPGIRGLSEEERDFIAVEAESGKVHVLPFNSALNCGTEMVKAIDETTRYLYIPGSLTRYTLEKLVSSKFIRDIKIVVKDGTKLFIEPMFWKKYLRMGLNFMVLDEIRLLAVTVNPYSPNGYFFDSEEFLDKMRKRIPDIPVMDVML